MRRGEGAKGMVGRFAAGFLSCAPLPLRPCAPYSYLVPTPIRLTDAIEVVALFDRAAEAMLRSPHRAGSAVVLPARGRLLATGDLHDNPNNFAKIIRLARLAESEDHHVILHEVIHGEILVNGVDLSHRMLARIASLVTDYPGQVHILIGNHEMAQLTGQRVSKGAGDNLALFNDGLVFVFGDAWEDVAGAIGRFIRAMPLAARSESGLLCAHSLPRVLDGFDTAILQRELTDADYVPPDGSAYRMVWGRGWGEREVDALGAQWGTTLFCLGHEHVDNGIAQRGQRAIILNSDHEMGAVIPIDLARVPSAEGALRNAVHLAGIPSASDRR